MVTDDGVLDALPLSYRDFFGTTPNISSFFIALIRKPFFIELVDIRTHVLIGV
jgi:hypothetical protein